MTDKLLQIVNAKNNQSPIETANLWAPACLGASHS